MKRGRIAILLSLTVAALVGFVVFALASSPPQAVPEFAASSLSSEPSPISSSTPPLTATSDPCHRHGVAYCALNADVTEDTIRSTICVSGWTATVRPPESYTERLKLQQISSEGLPGSAGDYEEDHRMPLELGGDPRDPANLSPESHASSYTKDAAETAAKREVCGGADLRSVQAAFVAAWLGPYPTYLK
jgi:hypothetical protein